MANIAVLIGNTDYKLLNKLECCSADVEARVYVQPEGPVVSRGSKHRTRKAGPDQQVKKTRTIL